MTTCITFLYYINFILLYYLIIGLWHARKQASMREDEEMLNMARPKLKPPSHLRGRELDMWHKEQNRIWQKSKKKEQQKELGKCVSFYSKLSNF